MPDETAGDFRGFAQEERKSSGVLCECGHDYTEHRLPGRECQHAEKYQMNCRCGVFIREIP